MLILLRFTLLICAFPASANPNLVVEAARRAKPPIIDAEFADWEGALWLELAPVSPHEARGYSRLRDDGGEPPGTARTAADLSGTFSLAWDDEAIYLAARITDNVHDIEGGKHSQWYFKDAISLFLDIPLDGDGPGWVEGDHAFSFVADPAYPPYGKWWRRGERAGHLESPAPADTRMAVRLIAEGYALEASVPMATLTRITPSWQRPYATRTIGFALVVTDPDGGERPFGGQLIYGGSHDDDGGWTRLRLRDAEEVSAPYIDISAEEMDFETQFRADQEQIKSFFTFGEKIPQADTTGLQSLLAAKYFQTYLNSRPRRFSRRALETAFMLWGNAGGADEIGRALKQISPREDVWDKITSGLRQAYYLQDRLDEGMALLATIEPQVVPLKSRSALLHTLGQYWLGLDRRDKARHAFAQIVAWRASLWHVGQAQRQLWMMDKKEKELLLDQL